MHKVFIVHGFEGSPNGGWRPWLMAELEKMGVYACALAMPDPNNPVPAEWVGEIARHVDRNARDRVYLVGHSLGVPAILRYLEKSPAKNVKGVVLVSGPLAKLAITKVDRFLKEPFDCARIAAKVKHAVIIHGDNDPNVPTDHAGSLAEALGAQLIMIKNGGHLNGSSGWFTLPQCLTAIKNMLN